MKLLDLINNDAISSDTVLKELLNWLDEQTVKEFYEDFMEEDDE